MFTYFYFVSVLYLAIISSHLAVLRLRRRCWSRNNGGNSKKGLAAKFGPEIMDRYLWYSNFWLPVSRMLFEQHNFLNKFVMHIIKGISQSKFKDFPYIGLELTTHTKISHTHTPWLNNTPLGKIHTPKIQEFPPRFPLFF